MENEIFNDRIKEIIESYIDDDDRKLAEKLPKKSCSSSILIKIINRSLLDYYY